MKNRMSNARIKHHYFRHLREAMGHDEATVDAVATAIARFETYTKGRDFHRYNIEQARGFKRYLAEQRNARTGKPLSKSTVYATLMHLKRFVTWLADQPGYRSRIRYADAAYFSPSEKDARVATARREPRAPTLEQVIHAINAIPATTDIERRDRALMAFIAITGARDRAVASMKLRHVDLAEGCVHQDGRDVQTKFAKTFDTWFFPVWPEGRSIVEGWVRHLRTDLLLGDDAPLFPATRVELDHNRSFKAVGLSNNHWHNTAPIRRIFRLAFTHAGLISYNPHSFRHMLARLGERRCRTPEEFKAWSQNLGHAQVMTTFSSYGPVPTRRQAEIMRAVLLSR